MSCRDLLTDFMGDPYPPVIQTAFRSGQVGLLSDAELAQELRFQPGMLPNALIQAGPTLTAAAWQAQVRWLMRTGLRAQCRLVLERRSQSAA